MIEACCRYARVTQGGRPAERAEYVCAPLPEYVCGFVAKTASRVAFCA